MNRKKIFKHILFNSSIFCVLFISLISSTCSEDSKTATDYYEMAVREDTIGNAKDAIKYYSEVIKRDSLHYLAYVKRGYLKGIYANPTNNFYNEAMDDFSKAIKIKSDEGEVYFKRGIILLNHNHKKEACEDFSTANNLGYKKAATLLEEDCK